MQLHFAMDRVGKLVAACLLALAVWGAWGGGEKHGAAEEARVVSELRAARAKARGRVSALLGPVRLQLFRAQLALLLKY